MILEVTQKQRLTISSDNIFFKNIFLGSRCGFFFERNCFGNYDGVPFNFAIKLYTKH